MAFELLPAEESDVADMVTIYLDSFANDPIWCRALDNATTKNRHAFYSNVFDKFFSTDRVLGAQVFKVVDNTTNKMVGFAKWNYPHKLNWGHETDLAATVFIPKEPILYPEGTNVPFQTEISRQMREKRDKWINPENTFYLHILAISPSHQRCGIGTMLVVHGLAAADAAGASTYLRSSRRGLPFYIRLGWKPVDESRVNLDAYGFEGRGWEVMTCLMREPGAAVAVRE
ncbi:hypothetical protein MMC07_001078 [Pseudocyphellaria aurata]|nr:hypothetical protein [Pseudocyphellaria aurata]